MYIKKSVLVICSILLIVATVFSTIMVVNPFGSLQFADLLKFKTAISVLNRYFYEDISSEDLIDGALLGVSASANDPYTVYMNKSQSESFMEDVNSDDYNGLGLYISNEAGSNNVVVVAPLSDSPAEEAGIVSGDKILQIDNEPVSGINIDEVAKKIRGKEGTKVKLKLLKKFDNSQVDLELTRRTIKRETVFSNMMDNRIGYIQITQFGINTADEFIKHFNKLVEAKMNRLVIDLRNNPGGYMEVAVAIADCFMDEGEIVYTLDKYGNKRDYTANEGSTKVKTAILTNNGTASASEILVGALKDYNLAETFGERTFGKGVTQIPYQFADGSIMKITDSKYYTPNGVCIDHEGITPDVTIEMSDEYYTDPANPDTERDAQLRAAVDWLMKQMQ